MYPLLFWLSAQYITSRPGPFLTAAYSTLGSVVSPASRSDGVCIVTGCIFAGQQFSHAVPTGSKIMLITEVLSVLTN